MKRILFLLLVTLSVSQASAQSGWSSGNYYAYKGNVIKDNCSYGTARYDFYGRYLGTYQTCRVTVWYQEWREGYIYLWNSYTGQWYTEWRSGTFWYFKWQYQDFYMGY